MCVFGESGSRPDIVLTEQASPLSETSKRLEPPVKTTAKSKNSTPSKQTPRGTGLGSRRKSMNDVRDSGIGSAKTKQKAKTPVKNTQTLRVSRQQADLTFSRSKTSDAILSRSIVKRRGDGNLSREPSSENLRRPKSTTGRKSAGKRSPEVRRRSAVSPVPTRRRLEPEYEQSAKKNSALRKNLNDNNLMFFKSFSADAITRGMIYNIFYIKYSIKCHF